MQLVFYFNLKEKVKKAMEKYFGHNLYKNEHKSKINILNTVLMGVNARACTGFHLSKIQRTDAIFI